mmetsp:Transcript_19920/g.40534  ORF Transcript_19920/g.40534 Transcript_19920/m.40534 type:complete len:453 (-) Transcript_19920:167-1525(-)
MMASIRLSAATALLCLVCTASLKHTSSGAADAFALPCASTTSTCTSISAYQASRRHHAQTQKTQTYHNGRRVISSRSTTTGLGSGSTDNDGGPGWIKEAMGDNGSGTGEDGDDQGLAAEAGLTLEEGLAGFAVDPVLGFVAIAAGDNSDTADGDGDDAINQQQERRRWVYSVVSPQDKTRLMSAEALTLVQLAGGIDVGAAVLPPEALMRIVRDEMLEDDEYDEAEGEAAAECIKQVFLVGVEAVPRAVADTADRVGDEEAASATQQNSSSSQRDERISSDASKLYATIRKLPGLDGATESSVAEAMQIHADDNGAINREAFTNVLDTLRRGGVGNEDASKKKAGVEFRLTVQITKENGQKALVKVRSPSTFHALGLSMRYDAPVVVSQECFAINSGNERTEGCNAFGCGKDELLQRFPAFRPMQHLLEDAQAVDGFISNMFYKENAPKSFE